MRRAAPALLAVLALQGCLGLGGSERHERPGPRPPSPSPSGLVPRNAAVVQDWIRSLNAGEYERAARYFAPNAVIEQHTRRVLRTHRDAVNFLRDLPCAASLTGLVDEGRTELATFSLSGPSGTCGERARVRFTIERGRFTKWHQLPQAGGPTRQAIRPG
jgi:hypothetical protein